MMSDNLEVIFHKMYLQESALWSFEDQILTKIFKCCNRQKSFKAPIKSITCHILTRSKQVINISRCNFVNIFSALNKHDAAGIYYLLETDARQRTRRRAKDHLDSCSCALNVCGLTEYFVGLMVHS